MTPPHKPKFVCECLKVTEAQLVKAIRDRGLSTLREVTACTSAGEGCNSCHPAIRAYLSRENRKPQQRPAVPAQPYAVG